MGNRVELVSAHTKSCSMCRSIVFFFDKLDSVTNGDIFEYLLA